MDELPKKIGKYPVLGIAGRGNMGVVYTGYDPFSDRDVAIKVCSLEGDQESTNRVARKLFFNEARMAGLLDHPNILRVLDAGENNRQPYIVMEYVEGGATLRPHCALPKLLPVPRVAEIVNKCANALDYAHRRGVIHRDIKPTNIMLTPDGDVRIADFGIAHRPLDDTTHVTGLLGSPRYMSPEQAQEQTVTYQTDLYSLGVVMFVLLTGNPPFTAPSLTDLLGEIVEKPAPSIRDFRPELSEGLESIVHCALQKDLRKRYRSGGELASDLAAVFDNIDHQEHSDNEEKRFDLVRKIRFFNELSDSELWETIRVGRICARRDHRYAQRQEPLIFRHRDRRCPSVPGRPSGHRPVPGRLLRRRRSWSFISDGALRQRGYAPEGRRGAYQQNISKLPATSDARVPPHPPAPPRQQGQQFRIACRRPRGCLAPWPARQP
jgi:serine/threonine protein kinase